MKCYYMCQKGICGIGQTFNIDEAHIYGWENNCNSIFFAKLYQVLFDLRRDDIHM